MIRLFFRNSPYRPWTQASCSMIFPRSCPCIRLLHEVCCLKRGVCLERLSELRWDWSFPPRKVMARMDLQWAGWIYHPVPETLMTSTMGDRRERKKASCRKSALSLTPKETCAAW